MESVVDRVRKELNAKYGHMMIKWYEAIDWEEPFVLGLIVFHLSLLTITLTLRNVYWFQVVVFGLICGTIYMSEWLNHVGHHHWKAFASQNYFDKHGVFMGIFVSGPLLLIGFIQLAWNMYAMANLVVAVKRHEFKATMKKTQ